MGLANILSITVEDDSGGLGGAAGRFSGFDLDGIKLSTVDCAGAASLSVFDFAGAGRCLRPAPSAPAGSKLFGTGPAGNTYSGGEGPPWGWRLIVSLRPSFEGAPESLVLQMTPLTPWGEEARAVRMVATRLA